MFSLSYDATILMGISHHQAKNTENYVALYRIAQEAFNNIDKHARATYVDDDLSALNGLTTLRIQDNGQGFDLQDVEEGRLGLRIMQERADAVGGRAEISSAPTNGTTVLVVVGN